MANKLVGIYCGHGKSTDGSWDPGTTYGNESEAALMLPITKAVAKCLKASGIDVDTDANNRNNINMVKQVARANEKKVDIFVSIHCDYYKAPTGTMPLYVSAEGKKLATAINKAVMTEMALKTRGVAKRTDLYELTGTNMPACIFETGSIRADLSDLKKADVYGRAIARGICNYLKVSFNEGAFKIKTKGKLIVRKSVLLTSRKVDVLNEGATYTIIETNKTGTRGKLKSGAGWITITSKYVERV